ncbi:hypothetical protein [Streptosporangium canum]|uniref:hypothetical protein n=1 Tax=Streptosporangium canum TaxID=324952 RepID=UPI00378CA4F2
MTPTTLPHPSFQALRGAIDWNDTSSILTGCTPIFDAFTSDPHLLQTLLESLPGDPHLADMCERYDFLAKLVLHDEPEAGVRIRLHLYREGFFDRPHNHRWPFYAGILHGSYLHRVFGRDDSFDDSTDPDTLRPILERVERPGCAYALQHTSVHTVQAQADTISLLVRGPAAKDRFLILDRLRGGSFWVYGAAQETPEQRAGKRMTADQLAATIARVRLLTAPTAVPAREQAR